MHEVTTRTIARTAFGLFCLAPTAAVLLWIVVTWTPWHANRLRARVEGLVADRTGLDCSIERYEHPSPDRWVLQDVRLDDPETARPVARVRRIAVQRDRGRINLEISQPTLTAESIDAWWRLVHDAALSHRDAAVTDVWLDARDLTIGGRDRSHSFSEVTATIQPVGDRVEAQLRLRPAGLPIDHPGIELAVVRDRGSADSGVRPRPVTSLRISTGELDVSLAALADRWGELRHLGDSATFGGMLQIRGLTRTGNVSAADWEFQSARLRGIELARLTQRQPHRLSGEAALTIQNGRLGSDGSVDFVGELTATDGIFDLDLLPLMGQHLGCGILNWPGADFRYDELGVRFNLFASQLELTGICQSVAGRAAEVALVSDGRAVMTTGPSVLPSASLAFLLAPPHAVAVPISRQTAGLLSVLRAPAAPLARVPDSRSRPAPAVRVGTLRPNHPPAPTGGLIRR